MVRHLLWTEIEGVEWDYPDRPTPNPLWRVPASKMKQEVDLREDEAFEHEVPLSAAAVEVLRVVKLFSSPKGPIFPGGRDMLAPLSENAVGYLYNREGWKNRYVPHDWRSSFSTVMNSRIERLFPSAERLLIDRLVIDLMLAHTPSGMSATEMIYTVRHSWSFAANLQRIGLRLFSMAPTRLLVSARNVVDASSAEQIGEM